MDFLSSFHVGGVVFVYIFIRLWSLVHSRMMLNAILRSAAGKKSGEYKSRATLPQRMYGLHIPMVTSYRSALSRYLSWNNLATGVFTGVIAVLLLARAWGAAVSTAVIVCASLFAAVFLCLPPVIISFINTTYSSGHPAFVFDLETDFIGPKGRERRRKLLAERKNCIIMTPDEFGARSHQAQRPKAR